MRVCLASDHGGAAKMKTQLVAWLQASPRFGTVPIDDLGTDESMEMADYPLYAKAVAHSLISSNEKATDTVSSFGILLCGSGHGMAMTANKFPHIRAAWCADVRAATLAREHNNANVLVMGAGFVSLDLAIQIIEAFLIAPFSSAERHHRRVQLMAEAGTMSAESR